MKAHTILGAIDDPELAEQLLSRRDALRRGGSFSATLALASVPAALAVFARDAFAKQGLPQQIIEALNFALTLEYLDNEFYTAGAGVPDLIPAADLPIWEQIIQNEAGHLSTLQGVLGDAAIAKPTFDFSGGGQFPDSLTNYSTFLLLSQGFEDTGVRAYKGQTGELIGDKEILGTALGIHSVEARHAAALRRLRGRQGWLSDLASEDQRLAPVYAGEEAVEVTAAGTAGSDAFDEPLTRAEVQAIIAPFIAG
jgi:hypothetical protein